MIIWMHRTNIWEEKMLIILRKKITFLLYTFLEQNLKWTKKCYHVISGMWLKRKMSGAGWGRVNCNPMRGGGAIIIIIVGGGVISAVLLWSGWPHPACSVSSGKTMKLFHLALASTPAEFLPTGRRLNCPNLKHWHVDLMKLLIFNTKMANMLGVNTRSPLIRE